MPQRHGCGAIILLAEYASRMQLTLFTSHAHSLKLSKTIRSCLTFSSIALLVFAAAALGSPNEAAAADRIEITWNTSTDVDLHVWDADGQHAWYGDNGGVPGGLLSEDITPGFGPETFSYDGSLRLTAGICMFSSDDAASTTVTTTFTDPNGATRTRQDQLGASGSSVLVGNTPSGAGYVPAAGWCSDSDSAPPRADVSPVVSGTIRVNESLTSTPGEWTGAPSSYAYQWQTCSDASGDACNDIVGATGSTYRLSGADSGRWIRVRVLAANSFGQSEMTYASAAFVPPSPQTLPAVTGAPLEGQELNATTGTWDGSPTSYRYQWQRCEQASDASCADISDATDASYVVQKADTEKFIRVGVVASTDSGASDIAYSASVYVPAAPVLNKSTSAALVSGVVSIRRPGSKQFVPLVAGQGVTLINKSEVDTTRGVVALGVSEPGGGPNRKATVSQGRFALNQRKGSASGAVPSAVVTEFRLSTPLKGKAARSLRVNEKALQGCGRGYKFRKGYGCGKWGWKKLKGRRTKSWIKQGGANVIGTNGVGAPVGTDFSVVDSLRATTFKVTEGSVVVTSKRGGKAFLVRAGQSRTVRAAARK